MTLKLNKETIQGLSNLEAADINGGKDLYPTLKQSQKCYSSPAAGCGYSKVCYTGHSYNWFC